MLRPIGLALRGRLSPSRGALHKKSRAVIDRPYSLGFAPVGALYERPRFLFCAKPINGRTIMKRTSLPLYMLLCTVSLLAQTGAKNGEWRAYGADVANTHYSPRDQINAS